MERYEELWKWKVAEMENRVKWKEVKNNGNGKG